MTTTYRIASTRPLDASQAPTVNAAALIAAAGYGCVHIAYATLLNRKNIAKRLGINRKEENLADVDLALIAGN